MTDAGAEAAPSVRPQRRPLRALTVLTVVLLALAAITALLAASQLFTTRPYSFSMFDYGGVNVIDVEGMPSSAAAGAGLGWLGLWALPTLILGALGFIALVATLSVRALRDLSRLRSLVVITAVFLGLGVVGGIATIGSALQPVPELYGSGSADGIITGFYLSIADGNFYESFPWNSLVPLLLPPTIWLLIIGAVGLIATVTVRRSLARRQTAAAQAETDAASESTSPQRRGSRPLAIITTVLLGLAALLVAGIVAAMVLPTASGTITTVCEEQDPSTGCFAGGPEVLFESGATSPLLPNLHWVFLLLFPAVTFLTLGLLSLIATLAVKALREGNESTSPSVSEGTPTR